MRNGSGLKMDRYMPQLGSPILTQTVQHYNGRAYPTQACFPLTINGYIVAIQGLPNFGDVGLSWLYPNPSPT